MPPTDRTLELYEGQERRQAAPARDIAVTSHRGHVRTHNQDAWASDARLGLMLVADGVGGQGDGRRASSHVISLLLRFIVRSARRTRIDTVAEREKIVTRALTFAHKCLRRENARDSGSKPSGTTIVGLWLPVGSDMATAFNVGDSSLFHFWAGGVQKISRDHSLHQLWLEGGRVGTEPSRRVIVQALGISTNLAPHIVSLPVVSGSVIVACTDGLTGSMEPDRMAGLLAQSPSAAHGASALLTEVLAGSARDNVTVAVCRL